MSRYRAPQAPSSPYITSEGVLVLRNELQHLWMIKRPEVTQAVSDAAKQGDRSENAEYIYGKKQLREIDGRVRFLRKRLEVLNIVEDIPDDQSKIYFGAWVTIENNEGDERHFRIVGPDEFNAKNNSISMDSPMAKALIGKTQNEEIYVDTPSGDVCWCVMKIQYVET